MKNEKWIVICLTLAGYGLFAIPLLIEGIWIFEWSRHDVQADRVAAYMAYFPEFARKGVFLGIVSVISCFVSVPFLIVASFFVQDAMRVLTVLGAVVALVLGILLTFLHMWQSL